MRPNHQPEVPIKIGYVQFAPVLGDLPATMQKIDRLVRTAAGADLLVLPELCNSGYNLGSRKQAWEASEEVGDSVFLRHLESLCAEHDLHVVTGFDERDGDSLYNSAILLGPKGYLGRYRKLHLFMNEKDLFAPGDLGLPVFDIGPYKLGLQVCFDWIFPEAWRVLALKGADLICHPSNLVLPFAQKTVPIHALVNRIYVVTANRIGTEGDLTFTGLSTIADPRGELLAQAPQAAEEVAVVEIDLARARDKTITARNDVFGDRRPEEYAFLLNAV